ncbi:MAG: branched-chain amino acid ABC transporter permease [Desulfatiglans sp.]|jgi:branched-chain amino acid transport system permease protein|nr:branched-chain amino acid ABC transporter permease [Thermodesulfobacteriota bacterium]MEE4354204.1 branched-chain amino acid ABC transporter permease [Desulfatiglans sp.]
MFLAELLISGIAVGSIYSLVALGFVLIYKSTRVLNFAQGELVLIGAFVAFAFLSQVGVGPWIALPLTMIISVLLGLLIERTALRPMIGEPVISVIMLTIGLSSILKGSCRAIWGSVNRPFPTIFPDTLITIGPISVPPPFFWSFIISIFLLIVFAIFFKYSRLGIVMRSTANDQTATLSLGISVKRVFALSWAIAALVGAIGGVLLGSISVLDMNLGYIGLKVFPVVILGGLDSIPGAIVGGIIIAVLENLTGGYLEGIIGGGVKSVAPFVFLLFVLVIKPYGLFGTEEIERL